MHNFKINISSVQL